MVEIDKKVVVYPTIPKIDGFVSDFEEPLNFCMDKFDTMELQKKMATQDS